MSRAKPLSELQDLDLQRDEAIGRLRQVVAALKGNPALHAARAAVEEAERNLADIERRSRRYELDRRDVKDHIEREERTLYSGRVKSPKELESLQMEVDGLRRRLGTLDDTALELMLAQDEAAEELARATKALDELAADDLSEIESLTQEKSALTARIRAVEAHRTAVASTIDAADLNLYERLRTAKGGTPVAGLRGEHCGACGMQLPRTSLDEARAGERIVFCPACHRIVLG